MLKQKSFLSTPKILLTITPKYVKEIIDEGAVLTDPKYTLVNESNESREQILATEPTANPDDIYYDFRKERDGLLYQVSNVLGGSENEAKARAKQILLSEKEEKFTGVYDNKNNACLFKVVDAAKNVGNKDYPFKSKYESVAVSVIKLNKRAISDPI
jgi:hypothetical protein